MNPVNMKITRKEYTRPLINVNRIVLNMRILEGSTESDSLLLDISDKSGDLSDEAAKSRPGIW